MSHAPTPPGPLLSRQEADAVVARVVTLLGGGANAGGEGQLPPRTTAKVEAGGHLRFVVRNRLLTCAACEMSVPQSPGRAATEALTRWVRDHLRCAPDLEHQGDPEVGDAEGERDAEGETRGGPKDA